MQTEDDIRNRIQELLDSFKKTQNSLASGDKTVQKRLNRQLSQGAAITVDTLLLVLDRFPTISAEWLMRGHGAMVMEDGIGPTDQMEVARLQGELRGVYRLAEILGMDMGMVPQRRMV